MRKLFCESRVYFRIKLITLLDPSNIFIDFIFSESESPASHAASEEREKSADLTAGSDDEQAGEEKKKKKTKKAKKVVKKKEKKEKEDTPPRLKLDLDTKPKVNKAKMFEQKNVEEAKPPPAARSTGKLTGALAAMKAEEAKMKEAEEQKKQIEEKMKRMKAEQEAKKTTAAEGEQSENEEGEHLGDENGSEKGLCIFVFFFQCSAID